MSFVGLFDYIIKWLFLVKCLPFLIYRERDIHNMQTCAQYQEDCWMNSIIYYSLSIKLLVSYSSILVGEFLVLSWKKNFLCSAQKNQNKDLNFSIEKGSMCGNCIKKRSEIQIAYQALKLIKVYKIKILWNKTSVVCVYSLALESDTTCEPAFHRRSCWFFLAKFVHQPFQAHTVILSSWTMFASNFVFQKKNFLVKRLCISMEHY